MSKLAGGELMSQMLLNRIDINPRIVVGKPVIRGTRVPVELILKMLSQGTSVEEILQEYPHLTKEDIRACLAYAAQAIGVEEVLPLERAGK
jgi:uncharacterized protein (DUF433 family)